MVMYRSTSIFGTIGKAMADKVTAKVVGKLKLSLKREELSRSEARSWNFEHF